jgi:O-antigen/teichoic acid export membrane protein
MAALAQPAEWDMNLLRTGGQILTSRLGQVAVNAAVGLLLARMLEPAGLGHYSLTLALVMFLAAVLNGGMGLAAVPPLRRGEIALARMLRAQAVWFAGTSLLLVLLGTAGARSALADLARTHLGWTEATAVAALVATVALLAFDIFFYDLLATGRLVVGPFINLARAAGQLVLLLIAVAAGSLTLPLGVAAFATAQLLAAFSLGILLSRMAKRGAGERASPQPAMDPDPGPPLASLHLGGLVIRTLRRGWHGQVSAVASLLHLRLDLALVSAFCGAATVGIYAFAVMLGELLWHLPGALSPVLVYSSAERTAAGERDRLAARAMRMALGATAVAAVCLALLAGPGLAWLFGGRYAASAPALRALLPGIVAFAPGAVLAGDFIGRGRPVWNAQASLLTVIINVACGLWWIPRLGAVGASLASTVAYMGGATVMVLRFRAVSGLSWSTLLLPSWRDFR